MWDQLGKGLLLSPLVCWQYAVLRRLPDHGPQFLAGFCLQVSLIFLLCDPFYMATHNMAEQVASPKLVSKGASSQDKDYNLI